MAENKRSVLIYVDWISIFEELSDEEAGKLVKHLFKYVNDKNPEAPDRLTKLLFEPIKQTLKRDLVKYEEKRSKNRDNINKRWNKNNTVEYERIKTDTNHTDSVIDSVSVSDSVIVRDKDKRRKRKPFTPPTLDDVKSYFVENGYDPAMGIKAWMGYDAANWFDSKGDPVLNWKQKMINVWFKNEYKINGNKPERKLMMP
jgi:hypothetical protein